MNIKEHYRIDIVDMGTDGEGIGRAEGMAVFVPGAVIGDRVLAEITQVKKNFARGRVLELEVPSPKRVIPDCSAAGRCGGCPLASLSYDGQLALKQKWVADRLARIGGFPGLKVEPIIGMKPEDRAARAGQGTDAAIPVRYRNKAHFPVWAGRLRKNREGKYRNDAPCRVGTYRAGSHDVIHCDACLIQTEPAEAIAAAVKQYVDETGVSVYDEKNGMGLLRDVVVRSAFATGEVMAVLVVNGDHLPKIERLAELMDDAVYRCNFSAERAQREEAEFVRTEPAQCGGTNETTTAKPTEETVERTADRTDEGTDETEPFWSLESIVLNINQEKHGELFGKHCITVAGKPVITDYLGDLQLEISPRSFYQVNPVQMQRLYDKVVEFADLSGVETVLDLYCGVGTIGLYCAGRAKRVIGVESVKPAVLDANRNAILNGIVNIEFICGKAEEILPKRLSGVKADVVIVDPPRSGCDKALLEAVLAVAPKRIVYVSCDPATLARDLKFLCGGTKREAAQSDSAKQSRALSAQDRNGAGSAEIASGKKEMVGVDEMGSFGGADRTARTGEANEAVGMGAEIRMDETIRMGETGEEKNGNKSANEAVADQIQYRIEKVQPVDMFPGAGHVETIVLFSC